MSNSFTTSYIPTNDPNTGGRSYPYHIYREYTHPSTFAYSEYQKAGDYPLDCSCGPIVDPVPVGLKPECFYHQSPHPFKDVSGSPAYFELRKPYAYNPYQQLSQPRYTVGGWSSYPNWKIENNNYLPYMNQRP